MSSSTSKIIAKSMNNPDEVRKFEKGKVELVDFPENGITIGRGTFEPGFNWEKCVKPVVKTDSCQAPHTSYIISGRMIVVMDDGTEFEGGPGDCVITPPGHNAWVVGDEPVVTIDFTGFKDYAKPS